MDRFGKPAPVLEAKLGSLPGEPQVALAVTEDYEGSWTRAFNPTDGSATYLLSGDGELVWDRQGALDAVSLAAVLDEHAVAGGHRRSRLVGAAVRPGEPAPDLQFEPDHGPSLAQLRGNLACCCYSGNLFRDPIIPIIRL